LIKVSDLPCSFKSIAYLLVFHVPYPLLGYRKHVELIASFLANSQAISEPFKYSVLVGEDEGVAQETNNNIMRRENSDFTTLI
jgi:hypothetical protein